MAVRDVSVLILYTLTGHILLQHRTDDALRLPGYWAFFGGGIEQGENPTEALEREIREELSYLVQNPQIFVAQKVRDEDNNYDNTKYVFVEEYQGQSLQLGEGQAMGWFLPHETHALKMVDHDRFVVQQVRDYLNRLS
jgi:8-oxo-dGTP pyrophosphatase MutT (NUDIX family)